MRAMEQAITGERVVLDMHLLHPFEIGARLEALLCYSTWCAERREKIADAICARLFAFTIAQDSSLKRELSRKYPRYAKHNRTKLNSLDGRREKALRIGVAFLPMLKEPATGELPEYVVFAGSALEEASYSEIMGEDEADLVFSDPPYNVPIQGHVSGLGKIQHREFAQATGEMNEEEFIRFLMTALALARRFSRDGSLHYWAMDWRHQYELSVAARSVYDGQVLRCRALPFPPDGEQLIGPDVGTRPADVELGRFARCARKNWRRDIEAPADELRAAEQLGVGLPGRNRAPSIGKVTDEGCAGDGGKCGYFRQSTTGS